MIKVGCISYFEIIGCSLVWGEVDVAQLNPKSGLKPGETATLDASQPQYDPHPAFSSSFFMEIPIQCF